MGFTDLLTHLAEVQEPTGELDRFRQPAGTWNIKWSAVPCRLTHESGNETVTLASRNVVEVTHTVYTTGEHEISEGDRISVADRDGTEIVGGLDVLVAERVSERNGFRHHLQVRCRKVKT